MRGISDPVKNVISGVIDLMFDRMAYRLLGMIPAFKDKKTILFSASPTTTLAHLFVQAMGNTRPLPKEEEVMRSMLSTAHGFMEALKVKTKTQLVEAVDSYVREARARGETPSESAIKNKIAEELNKAGNHVKTISEAEATKARNTGKLMSIARVGASMGVSDPTVFFVVIKDSKTCNECKRLHMTNDGVTPRVWKMSELGYSYHKKGENNPKISGLHPHCRCTLTLLSPGFGFKNGVVSFIGEGHDEHEKQRGKI